MNLDWAAITEGVIVTLIGALIVGSISLFAKWLNGLLKSRSDLMLRIRLLLDEYDALASPLGKSERPLDKATHSAGARREGGRMGTRPNS